MIQALLDIDPQCAGHTPSPQHQRLIVLDGEQVAARIDHEENTCPGEVGSDPGAPIIALGSNGNLHFVIVE